MKMWPFSKKRELPSIPTSKTDYPYGLFIATEAGYFLVREKGRYKLPTDRVMSSWAAHVSISSEAAVRHLSVLGSIGFRDGTIIRNQADKKEYLISKNLKRHITSPDVFDRLYLDKEYIVTVSQEEANLHKDGEVLS